jgi:hypothetical protein
MGAVSFQKLSVRSLLYYLIWWNYIGQVIWRGLEVFLTAQLSVMVPAIILNKTHRKPMGHHKPRFAPLSLPRLTKNSYKNTNHQTVSIKCKQIKTPNFNLKIVTQDMSSQLHTSFNPSKRDRRSACGYCGTGKGKSKDSKASKTKECVQAHG